MSSVSMLILYGSETGNAQDVAERIGREAQCRHFAARVLAMDAYDISQLPLERIVVFVASTTGQGDCPHNMTRFWKFLLRKSLGGNALEGLLYSVFGLGDSGYQKFNVVAKKLDRRLSSLGATCVLERGLGDDQQRGGYDTALDNWLPNLWKELRAIFPLPTGVTEPAPGDPTTLLQPKYKITHSTTPAVTSVSGDAGGVVRCALEAARRMRALDDAMAGMGMAANGCTSNGHTYGPYHPYLARMTVNQRVTSLTHFQDTRHIELDLADSGLSYCPGDLLAIFPEQCPQDVARFMNRVGLDANDVVQVEAADAHAANQSQAFQVCIDALVCGVMDINGGSPRRYAFQVMQHYATAEHEAERLEYFASPEGRDDAYTYNQKEGRSMIEVLEDFPSCALPLQWLLEVCPRLNPRYFSISSSLLCHPREAHVTVAIVEWTTPYNRKRQGVCTSWLSRLDPQAGLVRVPVWIESGALRMPADPLIPLILVGPGTGVAPFRAFLEERHTHKQQGRQVGACVLLFGCRSKDGDYYYREQWEQYQKEGVLHSQCGLITAFSRDQPSKVYVQHRIVEHGADLWPLIEAGAIVYVAGSSGNMPQAVSSAFQEVAVQYGGMSADEAGRYITQMQANRRYFVESWS